MVIRLFVRTLHFIVCPYTYICMYVCTYISVSVIYFCFLFSFQIDRQSNQYNEYNEVRTQVRSLYIGNIYKTLKTVFKLCTFYFYLSVHLHEYDT